MDGTDVWGAVLAWGNVELHQDGFRSEWQRPVVVAEVPWHHKARRDEVQRAAARHGAIYTAWDELKTIASEFGDPVPRPLIPVIPFSLLADRSAWLRDRDAPCVKELTERVRAGSMIARRELATRAVDVAVNAAFEGDPDVQLENQLGRVEAALFALLAATERWSRAVADRRSATTPEFRAAASWWTSWVVNHRDLHRLFSPPSTLEYREVQDLADHLPPLPRQTIRPKRRAKTPLAREQLLWLIRELGAHAPTSDFLIDGLWACLERRFYDKNRRSITAGISKLTGDLFVVGSRANAIVSRILDHPQPVSEARLRELAGDRNVHPCLRARALERLAESGSIEAIRAFLGHPLADTFAADDMLRRLKPA